MAKRKKKKVIETYVPNMRERLIILFVISFSIFISYCFVLNGTWAMDDFVANRAINISDIGELMGYRKIAMLSFMLNQKIGGFSPVSYRLVNIFIHIINTLLLFYISLKTMKQAGKGEIGGWVAVLVSIVFGLHPININAITYIVQRMASLATLFVLLSLIAYIHGRETGSLWKKAVFFGLSVLSLIAGVFTKENAVLGFLLIGLYELYFYRVSIRKRVIIALVLIIVCLLTLLALNPYLGLTKVLRDFFEIFTGRFNEPVSGYPWMARDAFWSPKEHILTEFRVVVRYLSLFIFPLPSRFVFDWWGYPLSEGILTPVSTLFSLLFVTVILGGAIFYRKRFPFLSFGIIWYFIAISLESFIAVGSDLYYEHRNYLPMVGLCLGLVGEAMSYIRRRHPGFLKSREMLFVPALVIAILLGYATYSRNKVFTSSVTLWSDTLKKTPENLRAGVALGNAYLFESKVDDAIRAYETVAKAGFQRKTPQFFTDALYNLGMMYLNKSDLDNAGRVIGMLDKTVTESWHINVLKGLFLQKKGDINGAVGFYNKALRLKDSPVVGPLVNTLLGDAYQEGGRFKEAERYYKRAISVDPKFSQAYYGLAQLSLKKSDFDRAKELLEKAINYDPDNPLPLADLSDIYLIKQDIEKAEELAKRSVLHSPPVYQPYISMANVLFYIGRRDEAEGFYKRALETGATDDLVALSKIRVLRIRGDAKEARELMKVMLETGNLSEKVRSLIRNAYNSQ